MNNSKCFLFMQAKAIVSKLSALVRLWRNHARDSHLDCLYQLEAAMTPEMVMEVFEKLNVEGRADWSIDNTCAGLAGWLAGAWDRLKDDDLAVLTAVGAVLWREGLALRQK